MASTSITHQLAWAAATDAGERSRRATGRKQWNAEDYDAAVTEFERVHPNCNADDNCAAQEEACATAKGRDA